MISLESLFNGGNNVKTLDYSLDFSKQQLGDLFPFKSPIMVSGKITNTADVVELNAVVDFSYTAPCDRCCTSTTKTYKMPMSYTLVLSFNDESGDSEDVHMQKYVNEYLVCENAELDLEQTVWEDILMFLPQRHLCSEDCLGLCMKCGKNLNEGDCDCEPDIDPRLEGLLSFLD